MHFTSIEDIYLKSSIEVQNSILRVTGRKFAELVIKESIIERTYTYENLPQPLFAKEGGKDYIWSQESE